MRFTPLFAVAMLAVSAPAMADHHEGDALTEVLAADHRAEDAARDPYRHPAETLAFFQVEPGMTVADYMPASGWYSRLLIPYLGSEGTYIGVDPWLHQGFSGYWDTYRNTAERLPRQATEWVPQGGAQVLGLNTDDVPAELHGTVDRFLIFREVHNMRRFGWLHESLMAARTLLKDDGMLGVVQHRAREDAPVGDTFGDKGYQHEADVIALFELHGFELVAASDINDNPADPSDWADGVWEMPPGMRGADTQEERDRRMALGESDRMTLLFRKRG